MKGEGRCEKFRPVASRCSRRLTRGAGPRSVVDWKEMDYCDFCDHGNREDWTLKQPLMSGRNPLGVLNSCKRRRSAFASRCLKLGLVISDQLSSEVEVVTRV